MTDTLDALFREAVGAMDRGDEPGLARLIAEHPQLLSARLTESGPWLRDAVGRAVDGFFRQPYLLWFVAEDPVRNGRLPGNIAAIAQSIIAAARERGITTLQEQLDYALTLVSWSWIARECGVQLGLIDVLVDAGAALAGNPENALVNGNFGAARQLVAHGAALTLGTAVCLERWDAVPGLAAEANPAARQFALVLAALNGKAEGVGRLLELGVDPNRPSANLYSHGTPLHHAVCSGSLETVRLLVEAGADPRAVDTLWSGTPLGWAEYYQEGQKEKDRGDQYASIAAFLRSRETTVTAP